MTFGPGKYDDFCTIVRRGVGMTEESDGGCVVVIVMGGDRGTGFSIQADLEHAIRLPDILEEVARQIRKDVAG